MTRDTSSPVWLSKPFVIFFAAMLLLAMAGGYQLSRIFSQVNEAAAQRSVHLLEIEESLDEAAIGLGKQVQEWKDMLLRVDDQALYDKHQKAFKESSVNVQFALLGAKGVMQNIGMDTAEIDRLIDEHKSLLSEYLLAYAKLKPEVKSSPNNVDMQFIGVDRKLQQDIEAVKAGISAFAKQQMFKAAETQGNRNLMIGLLGATSLFFMAMFGFVFARLFTRHEN
ncbi:MAG: hypothetical protein HOO97_12240 [Sideroxydans sp.]|nr:hypothetical protein [Sideroxydans sp.]